MGFFRKHSACRRTAYANHAEKSRQVWHAVKPPVQALPVADRVRLLSTYIKEFDPAPFSKVAVNQVMLAKHEGLSQLPTEELYALLPAVYSRSKAAYLELAEHLMTRGDAPATLTQARINDIADKIDSINSTTGKMSRLRLQSLATQWRNTFLPAWLRRDFGIVGGWKGRGERTEAIVTARQEQSNAIAQKQQRILTAAQKIDEAAKPGNPGEQVPDQRRLTTSAGKFLKNWRQIVS